MEVGSKTNFLLSIGGGDDVRLFSASECRNGMNSSEFHFLVDGGGSDVERTAKNERKTQDIIDLVGIVGAAGSDDSVRARCLNSSGSCQAMGVCRSTISPAV